MRCDASGAWSKNITIQWDRGRALFVFAINNENNVFDQNAGVVDFRPDPPLHYDGVRGKAIVFCG